MAEEVNPIRWTRDLAAAAWIGARLDRSSDRVTALVPAGYEAYARIIHPPATFPGHQLPRHQLPLLVDILRDETTTPDRCWFCVDDRSRSLDDQTVTERVRLPRGGASYLMHGGPIERALLSPPGKSLQVVLPEGAPLPDVLAAMREQLEGKLDCGVSFSSDTNRAQLEQWLAAGPPDLQGRAPDLWWPEDRAWFVCTPQYLDSTFVGGSRRLIVRLLAVPGLEVAEAQGTDPLSDVRQDERERTYGPVIASGTDAGRPWSLRGRISARGAAISLETSTGRGGSSGGALPLEDLGWKKLGHFGSVGSGERQGRGAPRTRTLTGVVSKQTAAIDVRLADGTSLPAQIIDTGDTRASFFVAVWSTPSHWEALIARDAAGAELETYRPSGPSYRDPSQRDVE
ncbi:MAG TPA: hypothetical protein VFK02_24290 [Kofleriaceae bacterium]|nr:hypothetical protein [Kofleriaceae bacterium]